MDAWLGRGVVVLFFFGLPCLWSGPLPFLRHAHIPLALSAWFPALLLLLTTAVFQPTGASWFTPGILLPLLGTAVLLSAGLPWWRVRRGLQPVGISAPAPALLALGALLAVLLFPYTHLAGIDTYKWQDLATSIRVESSILWLIHPLSAMGFTPRSYPLLQPLLLATIQTVGQLDVEGGFYILSLYLAWAGLLGMDLLASRCFTTPGLRQFTTCLYGLSPVFARYLHWATGRGAFLSLFPLLLFLLLAARRPGPLLALVAMIPLLLVSHKVALPAVVLVGVALGLTPLFRRMPARIRIACVVAAAAVPCVLLLYMRPESAAIIRYFLRPLATRYGWMAPCALLGLIVWQRASGRESVPAFVTLCSMAGFTLALDPAMYGALVATPFACLATAAAFGWFSDRMTRHAVRRAMLIGLAVSAGSAALVVARRNVEAMPHDLWRVAKCLEQADPSGPLIVEGPGRSVNQVQAYLSGCPRFAFLSMGPARIRYRGPWIAVHEFPRTPEQWAARLRFPFAFEGIEVALYGRNPRRYRLRFEPPSSIDHSLPIIVATNAITLYGPFNP